MIDPPGEIQFRSKDLAPFLLRSVEALTLQRKRVFVRMQAEQNIRRSGGLHGQRFSTKLSSVTLNGRFAGMKSRRFARGRPFITAFRANKTSLTESAIHKVRGGYQQAANYDDWGFSPKISTHAAIPAVCLAVATTR